MVVKVVVMGAVVGAAVGCGAFNRAASSADDIARVVVSSEDDVLVLAQREASSTGSTADDVLAGWRSRVASGADDVATRYAEVPSELRSIACDAATDVLADVLDGDTSTHPSILLSTASAIAGANQSVAARGLADDLANAGQDVIDGRPATLDLLLLKAGTCSVVG